MIVELLRSLYRDSGTTASGKPYQQGAEGGGFLLIAARIVVAA